MRAQILYKEEVSYPVESESIYARENRLYSFTKQHQQRKGHSSARSRRQVWPPLVNLSHAVVVVYSFGRRNLCAHILYTQDGPPKSSLRALLCGQKHGLVRIELARKESALLRQPAVLVLCVSV